MRTIVIFALIACLALASATQLHKAKRHDKETKSDAHFHALKNTAFGKSLMTMISLKFKTSGQVDDIVTLLDQLSADIRSQQDKDDADFTGTSAAYTDTINEQNRIIVETEDNIKAWAQKIDDDNNEISQASLHRDSLATEAQTLADFLVQLAATREAEHAAWEQRDADQKAILAGLDEVITLFTAEMESDENLDQVAAGVVLDLMNEIRAAIEKQITDDETAENDAQVAYNNFVDETNEKIDDLNTEIAGLDAQIAGLQAEVATLSKGIEDETVRHDNAGEVRDSTQKLLDDLTALHAHNTEVRSSQTVLIGQVKARLRENPDDVQSFLNEAL
jgi:prefoldin subunit 5